MPIRPIPSYHHPGLPSAAAAQQEQQQQAMLFSPAELKQFQKKPCKHGRKKELSLLQIKTSI